MNISPIHNEAALLAEDIDALIVADLHIGIEHRFFEAGARMPSRTEDMKHRLLTLLEKTGTGRLVILGDVKHKVPIHSYQESREIPRFFQELLEVVRTIDVTPGNHDGGLKRLVPDDVKIHSSKGFVLDDTGMWHGHAWPSKEVMASQLVLFAHYHPVTLFIDNLGTRGTMKCWVRGKWNRKACTASGRYEKVGKEFVMMPAFNKLCGGIYVNEERSWFGVVMRNKLANLNNSTMYLLDGTNVGKVKDNLEKVERKGKR